MKYEGNGSDKQLLYNSGDVGQTWQLWRGACDKSTTGSAVSSPHLRRVRQAARMSEAREGKYNNNWQRQTAIAEIYSLAYDNLRCSANLNNSSFTRVTIYSAPDRGDSRCTR